MKRREKISFKIKLTLKKMKKIFAILAFAMPIFIVSASPSLANPENIVKTIGEGTRFKLYPTSNMWTFLKLDTRNGKIWQVQWSLDNKNRFEIILSSIPQVDKDEEANGRFVLYPTTNTYNFIMLDQVSGKTYQVQWSQELNNRWVLPIEGIINF
jgi:hypothetical protein